MKNRAGRCGQTEELVIARAALHMWEEPCISGKEGSGAVFFVGCPLGCVFCQNREIARGRADRDESSRAGKEKVSDRPADEIGHRRVGQPAAEGISHQRVEQPGKIITVDRLAEIFLELQRQKANNINLVTPTHYVPQIIEAVREARKMGLRIPIVYNTGSIETPETVHLLEDTVDIFLPDLKFCGRDVAGRYANLPSYFDIATKAIGEMVRMRGEAEFDERGMMTRGVIVRHMVLPGHTKDSKEILRYLWENFGDSIYVSIMNQYTPMPGIEKEFPELERRVTRREYDRVVDYALELGFSNAFVQEGPTAEESFIPAFDGAGV
ncbi:MAG: radical SAM protein [Lachnospiraceae bacterium]|nr:radical SAM protein [Lachnospiraceae bacterium]